MGKPREEVKNREYYKDIHFLYEILGTLKDVDEVKLFIKDMLTTSELRMLKRRWHIANLLDEGHDMRSVARKAKASTQTVAKIKKIIEEGYGGLRLAINRVDERIKKEHKEYVKSKTPRGGSLFVKNWFK